MRVLLIDHGCCDHDHTRVHRCRAALAAAGVSGMVCGPSSVPRLEEHHDGMFGIHLHAVAAASHRFLAAVQEGSAAAFLAAIPLLSPRLLGSVRETARQLIAEAVDACDPDAIFVMHAGILTDLAVETGAPVAVHVSRADLDAAALRPAMRALVARAIGSCEVVAADDAATAAALHADWIDPDAVTAADVWPLAPESAGHLAAACRTAVVRRRG
jgi:hypothetical protein